MHNVIKASQEEENWYDEAVKGNWGQWTPISHCLYLSNNRTKIDSLPFEEERGINENNNALGSNYANWLEVWSDAESWLGSETFSVPDTWPTVKDLENKNEEMTDSHNYVAQLRVRFCNDPM